jgi:predicted amidohydrolase YtcJ
MYNDLKSAEGYKNLGMGAKAALFPNSRFSLFGIKIVGDGSNQTLTGAQTIPYLNTSEKGTTNYSAADLKQMVAAIKAAGLPVQIHCNGDAAVDDALDAIEAAYGTGPAPATGLNRIEHSTMARADQLKRMKALGVQPTFLMNHVFFYGAAYRTSSSARSGRRSWTRRAPASPRACPSPSTPTRRARRRGRFASSRPP